MNEQLKSDWFDFVLWCLVLIELACDDIIAVMTNPSSQESYSMNALYTLDETLMKERKEVVKYKGSIEAVMNVDGISLLQQRKNRDLLGRLYELYPETAVVAAISSPPAARLVGIELNPGPSVSSSLRISRLSFVDTIVMIAPILTPHCTQFELSLLAHTCVSMHTLAKKEFLRQHRLEAEANRLQREEIRARILELRAKRAQLDPVIRADLDEQLSTLYCDVVNSRGPWSPISTRGFRAMRDEILTLVNQGAQYSIISALNITEILRHALTVKYFGPRDDKTKAEVEEYETSHLRWQIEVYRLGLVSSPYHLYLLSEAHEGRHRFSLLQVLFRAVFASRHPISFPRECDLISRKIEYPYNRVVNDRHAPWNYEWRDELQLTRPLLMAGLRELMEWCINLHYGCSTAEGHLFVQPPLADAVSYPRYYPPSYPVFSSETIPSSSFQHVPPIGRDIVVHECLHWLPNAVDPMLLKSSYQAIDQEEKEKEANLASGSTACIMKRQEEHFHDRMYEWKIVRLCLGMVEEVEVLPLSDSPIEPVIPAFGIYSTAHVPLSHQLYTRVDEHVKMQQPRNAYEKVSPPLDEKEIDLTPKLFTHTRMDLTCTLPHHRLDLTMHVLTSHQFRCAFHHSFNNYNHEPKEQSRFIAHLFNPFFASQESRQTFSHLITNGTLMSFLKPFQDGRSKSSVSSSSSASSNGARSHDWSTILSDPQQRRLFEFIYFDLIRRKETDLIKLIHRYIRTDDTLGFSSAQLRDPINHQLSPLMYLVVEVRSVITAYRLFDLLVHESLLAHEMSIERVLDDERNPIDGKTLRELLLPVKNVELLDRIHEVHSIGNTNNSSAKISQHPSTNSKLSPAQRLFTDGILAVYQYLDISELLHVAQSCRVYQSALLKLVGQTFNRTAAAASSTSSTFRSLHFRQKNQLRDFLRAAATSSSASSSSPAAVHVATWIHRQLHQLDLSSMVLSLELMRELASFPSLDTLRLQGVPRIRDQALRAVSQFPLPLLLRQFEWRCSHRADSVDSTIGHSESLTTADDYDILESLLISIRPQIGGVAAAAALHSLRLHLPWSFISTRYPESGRPISLPSINALLSCKSTLTLLHIEYEIYHQRRGNARFTLEVNAGHMNVLKQLTHLRHLELSSFHTYPTSLTVVTDSHVSPSSPTTKKNSLFRNSQLSKLLLGGPKNVQRIIPIENGDVPHGSSIGTTTTLRGNQQQDDNGNNAPYYLPNLEYIFTTSPFTERWSSYFLHSLIHLKQLHLEITRDSNIRTEGDDGDDTMAQFYNSYYPFEQHLEECRFLREMRDLEELTIEWKPEDEQEQPCRLEVRRGLISSLASLTQLRQLTISRFQFDSIESLAMLLRPMTRLEQLKLKENEIVEKGTCTTPLSKLADIVPPRMNDVIAAALAAL